MNKKILALVDYKNKFGSKHFDNPYRSGMDKVLMKDLFNAKGFDIEFEKFSQVDLRNTAKYKNAIIIYTSSEDIGYHYKSYIEDVVFGLSEIGAQVVPTSKFMRANNNKVFMEFLRTTILKDDNFYSHHFGSLKDILPVIDELQFPLVFKTAEGASGTGVELVKNKKELITVIRKNKTYNYLKEDIKDYLRSYRHKGYKRESIYRNKFILQPFIPNLQNDWKVYVFGDRLYVFKRPIQPGRGIKASGGGYDNYLFGEEAQFPESMLNYAFDIFKKLDVPHVSLDIAYDGKNFYLIEFQALYFGTAGIPYSNGFFKIENEKWSFVQQKLEIEEVFVDSIILFSENI
jgi:glutathione synthase/RimK-type ligase-like ATP-grasp enzyme